VVQVQNHPDAFRLLWCCQICRKRCSLESLWLAFPQMTHGDAGVEGVWIHRGCLSGSVESVFRTKRVTLMRGLEAIRHLAASLEDAADHPAMRRQRPGPAAKAKS
jgi:hypothetical protein